MATARHKKKYFSTSYTLKLTQRLHEKLSRLGRYEKRHIASLVRPILERTVDEYFVRHPRVTVTARAKPNGAGVHVQISATK